jgi:hypothetical protein
LDIQGEAGAVVEHARGLIYTSLAVKQTSEAYLLYG